MTRTDDDRVAHILAAIDSIERWTAARDHDDLYRSDVLHQLEIIGEASSHLSERLKDAHPSIPWSGSSASASKPHTGTGIPSGAKSSELSLRICRHFAMLWRLRHGRSLQRTTKE